MDTWIGRWMHDWLGRYLRVLEEQLVAVLPLLYLDRVSMLPGFGTMHRGGSFLGSIDDHHCGYTERPHGLVIIMV